jgi:glycine cleavage system H protein
MVPQELKYTKEHEWVKVEGDEAVIGITDHAQSQLGDITFVELPEKDRRIKQFESISTVESVKAASDIYAPVSGKITDVNDTLQDSPELINRSPYEDGWVCRVSVSDVGELAGLMDAAAYEEYLKEAH